MRIALKVGICGFAAVLVSSNIYPQNALTPLHLEQVIELPGVQGGFDHLAFDSSLNRLFVTAEDQGVVLAVDLRDKKIQTIPGFVHPHSILVQPEHSRIFVTDSGDRASAFVDTKTLGIIQRIPLALGANCLLYDSQNHFIYVTAGGDRVQQTSSTLQAIEGSTGQIAKSVSVAALHLQPMALDATTHRLFVNVADHDVIAIYNSDTLERISAWRLPDGHRNSPIAIDPEHHRLFVIAIDPGILLELDSTSGTLIASAQTPPDPDDIDFDESTKRIYVPGDGFLNVYSVGKVGEIHLLQQLETGVGARTGTLIQSEREYIVAVPSSGTRSARLLVYSICK